MNRASRRASMIRPVGLAASHHLAISGEFTAASFYEEVLGRQ
jgi:hypothetical protein